MHRRSRILAGLVALATASATLAVAPATAAPLETPGAGARHQVTLVTGDRVLASQRANGEWSLALEPAGQGKAFGFRKFPVTRGGSTDWYLVPEEAERALDEGLLDRELFNITGLIRQGYDDARSDTLPLLVEHHEAGARSAAELPGIAVRRELPELNLTAVAERKAEAGQFWQHLSTARSGGVRKIWLNGKVRASLDTSVPQVGAPAAWQGGHTGKGVTVAVLDTGIDDTHPDVAGKVKHSKDFSGKGNVKDGDGHGTHVAATAVGSGAAEGGKFKGVAPEAGLAVGKVLDDNGSGQMDQIIAGMTWAAAEVRAKVVNMSLGGYPTDGTDPMSQALNTLTRKHGTLFVVAAGNYSGPGTVTRPGSADLALTVGSVTKSGARSDFSSQGPRDGDGAVKPEIAAPGSDVVAARATGTGMGEPVNDRYTKASGTSMASPHVAGGAAILAQRHPDWTPEQLKAALVATAAPVARHGVFAVGSGRMDLAKAAAATVHATPSAHNVLLKWPSTKPESRTVSYTNSGTAPVTLDLKLDLADATGAPASAGLGKLSANSVTVPAGGKAEVTVSVTPRVAKPGSYGGTLTATGGGATLRTLIGAHEEGERYDVTAKAIRRDGKPATPADDGYFSLTRTQDGVDFRIPFGGTVRVPPGEYLAYGTIRTPKPGAEAAISTYIHPRLRIGKATTLTFDARLAKPVRISTDQPAARDGYWTAQLFHRITSTGVNGMFGHGLSVRFDDYSSYSEPGVSSPAFTFVTNQRLEEPEVELFADGPRREELYSGWLRGSRQEVLQHRLPSAHGGTGTPEDLAKIDAKGRIVVLGLPRMSYDEVYQRIRNVKAAGGVAVVLHEIGEPGLRAAARPAEEEYPAVLPSLRVHGASGPKLAAHAKNGGQLSLTTRTSSKYRYELAFPSAGRIPAKLDHQIRTADLAAVTMAYHGYSAAEPPVVGSYVDAFGEPVGVNVHNAAVPGERVEHFTPGNWEISVGGWYHAAGSLVGKVRLEAGKSYRQEWNKAVNGPGFTGTTSNELGKDHPWVWSKEGLLDVTVPWWTDAAGHPRPANPNMGIDKGSTVLYADGVEVARQNLPGRGVFLLARAREHRLEAEVARDAPWWRTSTKITSAWTFPTPGFRPGAVPLLNVRYAPPVDQRNLAPADRDFAIPVTVPRQDGPAEVRSLTVDYSTDDGATWQAAKVEQSAAGWTVTVRNPAKGFVSLRGKASDGVNSVEQTIVRAYEIG